MNTIKEKLKDIWENKISDIFNQGLITYERQLQAEIYYLLKNDLLENYKVWIEPVIYMPDYNLDKVKPDIFITKDDLIICIIELKFTPWEFPKYESDIRKLIRFDDASNKLLSLPFGYIPISSDWNKQKHGKKKEYTLTPDHLNCFMVFGKPDSDAFKLPHTQRPNNFLHLYGYINDENVGVFKSIDN